MFSKKSNPRPSRHERSAKNHVTCESLSTKIDRGTSCDTPLCVDKASSCDLHDPGVDKATSCVAQCKDKSLNTEDTYQGCKSLLLSIEKLKGKNEALTKNLLLFSSQASMMKGSDEQTLFYTGLPSYKMFESLLNLLLPLLKVSDCLSAPDQLLLVLMKLRLAVPFQDLSYRFHISISQVSTIFHLWLDIMSRELKQLIVWPDRGIILETLPECFKSKYLRTTCIIDCSEVFLERPSSLSARAETYSSYKSHNTVKFLVAVSPTGAVIFVSKCWGGRVSDRHLTIHSGFLDKLTYGDLILADRGFDIADDLALIGASLSIPPFTRGKPQLSQREVDTARALSRVRIHVERAIGRIKNFKILQSTLPIKLIKRQHETEYTTIDKILVVCCALCNLHPKLIV